MKRWVPLLLAALAAGCGGGGGGGTVVAHVGDRAITQRQLDQVVAHFRTEAQREGRSFPAEKTRAFRLLRNHLLGLLVYRTELAEAADRLGLRVSESEVAKRMPPASGEQEGEQSGDPFPRDSVEAQLLYEKIFARVTRAVKATTQAELSARRNQAMATYVARLQRTTKVRYEPGFAPGP